MTHIEVNNDLLPLVGSKQGVLNSTTGSVEHYDFSKANSSYEARVQAVTKVASICYGNPKALGSINLFDRLQAEAAGLPSSSYEFVPVLLDGNNSVHQKLLEKLTRFSNVYKYGELINEQYLLTNYRALVYDYETMKDEYTREFKHSFEANGNLDEFEKQLKEIKQSFLNLYNTPEECEIIKKHFKVYLFNVDLATRAQMVRHRCSWQELSRRYVSGKKQPFEFYVSEKMKGLEHECSNFGRYSTEFIIQTCIDHYNYAIAAGVKPEEARRILPQAMMTTIWGAFQPTQLANFFTLRLDSHAQREIRLVAEAMREIS